MRERQIWFYQCRLLLSWRQTGFISAEFLSHAACKHRSWPNNASWANPLCPQTVDCTARDHCIANTGWCTLASCPVGMLRSFIFDSYGTTTDETRRAHRRRLSRAEQFQHSDLIAVPMWASLTTWKTYPPLYKVTVQTFSIWVKRYVRKGRKVFQ